MAAVDTASNQGSSGLSDHFHGAEHDFSLVLGGPLHQLYRRSHLAGDGLELLRRRVIVITAIAWERVGAALSLPVSRKSC